MTFSQVGEKIVFCNDLQQLHCFLETCLSYGHNSGDVLSVLLGSPRVSGQSVITSWHISQPPADTVVSVRLKSFSAALREKILCLVRMSRCPVLVTPNGLCSTHKTWRRRQNVVTPSHTCCRGTLLIRLPLCVCPQVCPGRVRHPAPVSATPFYDREVPAVSSPALVDGLWPSAMVCK